MVRIEIRNFQSVAHEVVEVDGFSALAGRSNIGKSAIVRAVKAALTGSPVDNYVRHSPNCLRLLRGAKTCKCSCLVHIETEGLDLLWEKGDAVNRYEYNGTEHTVVGRGTPDFLLEDFGPVKLGDEKEILQVSDQFKPIFILNKPGTVAADILSDVAKLDQINSAIRLADKDRREAKATRKVREKDVLDLRMTLAGYDGLDGVVERVVELEELDRKAESVRVKSEKLERFLFSVLSVGQQIRDLKDVNLVKIPSIDSLTNGGEAFFALEEFVEDHENRAAAVLALEGVDVIELPSFQVLSSDAAHDKLVEWASKVELLREFFGKFQPVELIVVPDIEPLKENKESYLRLDSWATRVYEVSRALLQVKKELKDAIQEKRQLEAELGICPFCERPFDSGHECQE